MFHDFMDTSLTQLINNHETNFDSPLYIHKSNINHMVEERKLLPLTI